MAMQLLSRIEPERPCHVMHAVVIINNDICLNMHQDLHHSRLYSSCMVS
jgi:hypothetical protein